MDIRLVSVAKYVPQRIRDRFKHKPNRFIALLMQQCALGIEGTEALIDYMRKPSKKNAERVRHLEREADEVRRILADELNHTFVTPIDREDIYALSRAIDDILDDTWFTVNEMDILDVEPNAHLQEMAAHLNRGAEEIKLAIDRLELNPGVTSAHTIRARSVKGEIETLYTTALADSFVSPKSLDGVVVLLKLREIYRHLFHAGGRIGDAANTIDDIAVKSF